MSILTSAVWLGDWCHVVLCPLNCAEGSVEGPLKEGTLQEGKSQAFLISNTPVPSLSVVVFKIRASTVLFYILFADFEREKKTLIQNTDLLPPAGSLPGTEPTTPAWALTRNLTVTPG